MHTYHTELIPLRVSEASKRALLIASETEIDKILSEFKCTTTKENKSHNEYDGKNILINISGENLPLDICTNHMNIQSKICGYRNIKPLIYETRTKEYRQNLSTYQKIDEFIFRMIGLEKKGIIIENPDPKSWYVPKVIIYTGNVDYYDEDQNDKSIIKDKKYIEDIIESIKKQYK